MASPIKTLFSQTAYYGLGNVISRGITFLMLPLLTNLMEPAEYGKLGLVQTFIALSQVFLVCGMRPAIIRYSSGEAGYTKETVFSAGLFWVMVFTFPGLVLLNAASSSLMPFAGLDSENTYRYMLLILFLDALSIPPYALLQSAQRPKPFIILKLLHVLIHFFGAFFLLTKKTHSGLDSVLLANIAASLAQFVFFVPIFLKKLRFRVPVQLLKKMLSFGAPFVPAIIFVVIIDVIDRVLIAHLLNIEQVGFYSAAAKLAMIMFLAVFAFQTAWSPFFLSHKDDKEGPQIFARVFTYFLIGTCGIFLTVGLFYREIALASAWGISLVGAPYRSGLEIIPPLLAAYIFSGIYTNLGVGIHIREKTKYFPIITFLGAAANVTGNFLLIPAMGIMGAALSTLLAYFLMTIIIYPIAMRLFPIEYDWSRIIKISGSTVLLFFIATEQGRIGFRIAAVLIFVPMLWILRVFEASEISRFKTLLKK